MKWETIEEGIVFVFVCVVCFKLLRPYPSA